MAKRSKLDIAVLILVGIFFGIGFQIQINWWIRGPLTGPRLWLSIQAGIVFLFLLEWGLLWLRSRVSGRSALELLPSETWTSLPLAFSLLMILEALMPLRYYALLVWSISLGATISLKGILLWRDNRGEKKPLNPQENFLSKAFIRFIERVKSKGAAYHIRICLLAVLLTVPVRWPALKWPIIPREGIDVILYSGTTLAFELWLAALYSATMAGSKIAGRKGERYGPLLICLAVVIFILAFHRFQSVPSPWKTALSLPSAMTRPLFSDTQDVIPRRVSIWNQTRDAVVTKIPVKLVQDFPPKNSHQRLNLALGVVCGGKTPGGGAHFSISASGKEIWKDDLSCPEFLQHNDWRVAKIAEVRGRVELKITPRPSAPSASPAAAGETLGIVSAFLETGENERRRPNIMLLLIDTLRADHIGTYGYSRKTTPNIDSIAADGVVFESATSQEPHTVPSTASILTGLYPANHGVVTIIDDTFNDSAVTLGERLMKGGYITAGFTGTNIIIHFLKLGERFETFDWRCAPKMNWQSAECMAGRIIPWIEENKSRPFFLYAHFFDPHDSYNAPPPYAEMFCKAPPDNLGIGGGDLKGYTRGFLINFPMVEFSPNDLEYLKCRYDGEIAYVDSQIGKILEHLRATGILDNTILIITADHGEEFLEHGRLLHGQDLHGELTHVPMIFRYPPAIGPGRIKTPVETVDIVPTILDLAGIQPSQGLDGRSLVPAIRAGDTGQPLRKALSWTDHITYRSVSIQADNWKYIRTTFPSSRELFNLENDPDEKNNLAGKYPKLAAAFEEEAQNLLKRKKIPHIAQGLSPALRDSLRSLGYIH